MKAQMEVKLHQDLIQKIMQEWVTAKFGEGMRITKIEHGGYSYDREITLELTDKPDVPNIAPAPEPTAEAA